MSKYEYEPSNCPEFENMEKQECLQADSLTKPELEASRDICGASIFSTNLAENNCLLNDRNFGNKPSSLTTEHLICDTSIKNHEVDITEIFTNTVESGYLQPSVKCKIFTNKDNESVGNPTIGENAFNSTMLIQPRRVSFPKSDNELVTGYLEPADPWDHVFHVKSVQEITKFYINSCKKHNTQPLECVLDHLQGLDLSKSMRQRCISLKNNKLTPEDCEALEEIFKRVQYEVIDISSCQLNETASSALFDMIEYYEAANELDISENPEMSSRGWQSCGSMIRRSRALQILHAHGNPLSDNNALHLGKALNNSCLHTIKLEHCGLRGLPIGYLCYSIRHNTTLRELWLASNDLSDLDAEKLAELLKVNAYIQFLDISNNNIKDSGLKQICIALIHQATFLVQVSSTTSSPEEYQNRTGRNSENMDETNANITNIEGDMNKCEIDSMKNSSTIGRSMLETLLRMSKDVPGDENVDAYRIESELDKMKNDTTIIDTKSSYMDSIEDREPIKINRENISTILTTEGANELIKAEDFNTGANDFDDTQSGDSAFESASEGEMSKILPEETPNRSLLKTGTIGKSRITNSFVNASMTGTAQITRSEPATPLTSRMVVLSVSVEQNTRTRSHSSDSLSSDNSLDGSVASNDLQFSSKINEKLTKNDTLTRQKQFDIPEDTTKKPSGLKALVLWNNNLTKESAKYIADMLAINKSLEFLNIGKNILSNDFIESITESLCRNATLTNLGLQSAHLSCTGVKKLSSILQFGGNSTLQRIDLRGNNIQVESLSSLEEALKSNKAVTQIDIDDVPKRISVGNESEFHYLRILSNIRSLCSLNYSRHSTSDKSKTNQPARKCCSSYYLSPRKISLTCYSAPFKKIDNISAGKMETKKRTGIRLRSPLPSPPSISPSSSPVPSPSKSRFQVFRVMEGTSPAAFSPQHSKEVSLNISPRSRFRVMRIEDSDVPIVKSQPLASPAILKNNTSSKETTTESDGSLTCFSIKESADTNPYKDSNASLLKEIQNNNDNQFIRSEDELHSKNAETNTSLPRGRKLSWIANSTYPATVDRLLSLFQNPGNLFSRPLLENSAKTTFSTSISSDIHTCKDDSCQHVVPQSYVPRHNQCSTSGFLLWCKDGNDTATEVLKAEYSEASSIQTSSFFDAASKQFREITDFAQTAKSLHIAQQQEHPQHYQNCDITSEINCEIKENISPKHSINESNLIALETVNQQLVQPQHLDDSNKSVSNQPPTHFDLDPTLSSTITFEQNPDESSSKILQESQICPS